MGIQKEHTLTTCTDNQLVTCVKAGSADAFVELATRYFDLIRAKSASFHGTFLDRDDLCQEGLLGLYHAACTYQEEKGIGFSSYAGVCIRNCVIMAYRKAMNVRRRPPNGFVPLSSNEGELLSSSESEDPESMLLAKEHLQAVLCAIQNTLSSMEQHVLMLYLSGCSYAEIAKRMGITQKAADNALQRVRQKLKKQT